MTAGLVFGSKVINAALGFVMSILIARALGPDDRGAYFLALTIAVGAFSLGNLSLDASMFWAVARKAATAIRLWRTVAPIALLSLGIAALLYVVAWFAGLMEDVPEETVIAGLAVIPVTLGRYLVDGVLYVKSRARTASLALVVSSVVQLALVVGAFLFGWLDSTTVLVISAIAGIAGTIPALLALIGLARSEDRDSPAVERGPFIAVGLKTHFGAVGNWLSRRVDVPLVALLVDPEQLGLYTLAITLAEFALYAPDSLALAALGRQGALEAREAGRYAVSVAADAARIGVATSLLLIMLGWPLILIAYGSEWLDAFPALIALAPGVAALAYVRPLGPIFIREGRTFDLSVLFWAAAIVNVAGTVALVPMVGIVGGGIASSAAYVVLLVLVVWRSRAKMGLTTWAPSAIPAALRSIRGR